MQPETIIQALLTSAISNFELPVGNAASLDESKDFLRKLLLDAYRDDYKEINLNWRNLETKAQGNIAVAGIFIAAAFAYIEKINEHPLPLEKFLFGVAIFLLGLSVMLSIFVLAIRVVPSAPGSDFLHLYISIILKKQTKEELREALEKAFNLNIHHWREAARKATELSEEKAQRLSEAQGILLAAIVLVAILTIGKVFG